MRKYFGALFRLFTSNFNDSTPTHDYGISYLFFNFDEEKKYTSHSLVCFFYAKIKSKCINGSKCQLWLRWAIPALLSSSDELLQHENIYNLKNTCSKKKWTNISFEMRRGYLWIRLKILTKLCAMFAISITWMVYHFRKLECTKLFGNAILRVSA